MLTALEGFSRSEAAHILGVSEGDQAELERAAIAEIEAELSTRVLVIEDEPIIAADLESLVEELGHKVTGNATTYTEAMEMVKSDPPGLVLCDIQLADGSSGIGERHPQGNGCADHLHHGLPGAPVDGRAA